MTVSVLLPYVTGMQSARAVLYCNMRPVWLYHILPYYIINGKIWGGGKCIKYKMCFDFLYKFCLKHFLLYEEIGEVL
jgi:hypothetical protein